MFKIFFMAVLQNDGLKRHPLLACIILLFSSFIGLICCFSLVDYIDSTNKVCVHRSSSSCQVVLVSLSIVWWMSPFSTMGECYGCVIQFSHSLCILLSSMHQVIGLNLIELISVDYLCDPCCLAGN